MCSLHMLVMWAQLSIRHVIQIMTMMQFVWQLRAARIVRSKLQSTFTGIFDMDCKMKSIPHSLLTLVSMIHRGPSIKAQRVDGFSQATLSVPQSCYSSGKQPEAADVHHNKAREPTAIYIGLNIYARTRKHEVIHTVFDFCLSVSGIRNIH